MKPPKSGYTVFIIISMIEAAIFTLWEAEFYSRLFHEPYWYTWAGKAVAWALMSMCWFGVILFLLWIRHLFGLAAETSYADEPHLNPTPQESNKDENPNVPKSITESSILTRLHLAIDAQEAKASGNLFAAIVLTVLAVVVLLGSSSINAATWSNFLIQFIPKLSLSVILETAAYFFMRLYKSHLEHIAALHQEINRVQIRLYALHQAGEHPNSAISAMILLELAHFEPTGQAQQTDYLQHTGGIWTNFIQSASDKSDRA